MTDQATATTTGATNSGERHVFQAEVARLLHLMVHSVYSQKEVFLRELISNAADAIDKLRHQALTNPDLVADDPNFAITLSVDPTARTLTIADNGIGMDRDELIKNLGTIAHSGTRAYMDKLASDSIAGKEAGVNLIGQFGVGFYAAFMVADKVVVTSRKAGAAQSNVWISDGLGEFSIDPGPELAARGTSIVLHLKADEGTYLTKASLSQIVRTYSDHVAVPIRLEPIPGEEAFNEDGSPDEAPTAETLNAASAIWTRPKADITPEQYAEHYHSVGHMFDEPWLTLHYKAEGTIEYTVLLYVPSMRPFDLFDPKRSANLKLYVRRVFIADDAELLPPWLRFIRGVVDSEDMPLNLSREMLQNNPLVAKIRTALVKRLLSEITKKAEAEPDAYAGFWDAFGPVLKEGLYEDPTRRDDLLGLLRFKTTKGVDLRSVKDYMADLKVNQTAVYYLLADDPARAAASPQLEGFKARGIEVLLLSDPVDGFWTNMVREIEGKPLKSVTQGAADLELIPVDAKDEAEPTPGAPDDALDKLIAAMKTSLGDAVVDVRKSDRLTDSPVCLIANSGAMDMQLERLLVRGKEGGALSKRILEINPKHRLITALAEQAAQDSPPETLADIAWLLFDQARILENEPVSDPAAFARRFAQALVRGLGA
jgi:molecular chaperone HtpG